MYIYGLGENTKDLIIKLLNEIDNKTKNIEENRRLIEQSIKLTKLLNKTIPQYQREREEVLEFLKEYNNLNVKEYDSLCTKIKEINNHSIIIGIKDDSIISRFAELITLTGDMNDFNEQSVLSFVDKKSNTTLFDIPVVNETINIYKDNDYLKEYRKVNTQYKYFIKLKEFINKYLNYKEMLKNNKLTNIERNDIKREMSFYSKEIRTTKAIIMDFLEEDSKLKQRLFNLFNDDERMLWTKLTDYTIKFYEDTYFIETIDNLVNVLEENNSKSKLYCDNLKISLYQKIQSRTDLIKEEATEFKQNYILNYIDNIYPGFTIELNDSLVKCDKERIKYLKSIIANTLYLEDTDYEDKITNKIKCL